MAACVRVVVSGRVQGVFFRASCADEARRRGVGGWVRNLPDGRVEASFEGEPDEVDGMIAWSRHGPPAARVDALEIEPDEPLGMRSFVVAG